MTSLELFWGNSKMGTLTAPNGEEKMNFLNHRSKAPVPGHQAAQPCPQVLVTAHPASPLPGSKSIHPDPGAGPSSLPSLKKVFLRRFTHTQLLLPGDARSHLWKTVS